MSTFEYLTTVRRERIKSSREFFHQQVREKNLAMFDNTSACIRSAFEVGLLLWAHNSVDEAVEYFRMCVSTNQLRAEQYDLLCGMQTAKRAYEDAGGQADRLARVAKYFLLEERSNDRSASFVDDEKPGYEPWFERIFIDACIDGAMIDADAFERSKKLWVQRRFPAAKLEEFDFYREVLEGEWSARGADKMLERHAALYAKRAKKKGLGDLIAGEGQFNPLVVDFIFAAILKRIGWKGQYRHAWPEDGLVPAPGARPVTTQEPSQFLKPPASSKPLSVTTSNAQARIDPDEILSRIDSQIPPGARRSAAESKDDEKRAKHLSALGIGHDRELAEVARRYRLSDLASPRQNAGSLSEPNGMVEWTEYFRVHHGMSDDFVLLTAPIEIADWEEPEGGQFVYSIRDGKVYLADLEDLADPARTVTKAQSGISMWPSFGTFLLWYLEAST